MLERFPFEYNLEYYDVLHVRKLFVGFSCKICAFMMPDFMHVNADIVMVKFARTRCFQRISNARLKGDGCE